MLAASNPRGLAWGAAVLAAAGALTLSGTASAYCRTASCGSGTTAVTGKICVPDPDSVSCGVPLVWTSACVSFSIQENASSKGTSYATTQSVFLAAFNTWMTAPGAGGSPNVVVKENQPAVCDKIEYNEDEGNANIIMFRDTYWPYEGSPNTLALTTVTYAIDTGAIYDADMELNSFDNTFTTGDTDVETDLLSVATHEAGHFLGMAHTTVDTATMWQTYSPGTVAIRTLSPDDIDGIMTVYPVGTPIPQTCDDTPRHGFSPLCGADQKPLPSSSTSSSSCSLASGDPGGRAPAGFGAVIAGLLALGARRRRLRHRRHP